MGERIQIRYNIGEENYDIQAELSADPIVLTREGKIMGSIVREPDGHYSPAAKMPLSQEDIDAIGKEIDRYIKYFKD